MDRGERKAPIGAVEEHGGQQWRKLGDSLMADLSVPLNPLGPSPRGLTAARQALEIAHHYPDTGASPARAAVANFLAVAQERILLGNGASELIDLVMRAHPPGTWYPGPFQPTYREFHRAAALAGHSRVNDPSSADLLVIVRPNNPTGEFQDLDGIVRLLDQTTGMLVIDESYLPFMGPAWLEESAIGLLDRFPGRLTILHSWTKFTACAGMRSGSVVADAVGLRPLRRLQIPWSINTIVQAYLPAALADTDYLTTTWQRIPAWRQVMEDHLDAIGLDQAFASPGWVPWVTVRFADQVSAGLCAEAALGAGFPLRDCASYGLPEVLRMTVCDPADQAHLFAAIEGRLDTLPAERALT